MRTMKRSVWVLSSVFFGILFASMVVGSSITEQYEGQINAKLGVNAYEVVDDSSNSTPDVTYFKSDYIQTRWRINPDNGEWKLQMRKNTELCRTHAKNVSREVDNQGSVLLWNKQALPLAKESKVSLFGIATFKSHYVTTGQGSGFHDMNSDDTIDGCLRADGVEVNPTLLSAYNSLGLKGGYGAAAGNFSGVNDQNYLDYRVNEAPFSTVKAAADSSLAQYGDAAIYVISRLGSENGDSDFATPENDAHNYQELTREEEGVLRALTSYKASGIIKKIVVVLNTCNALQFQALSKYDVDACLWVGNGGTSAFASLADVLTGHADPSGHLPDTFLYDSYSAPATFNIGDHDFTKSQGLPAEGTYAHNTKYVVYQEGIYVGYKYFETRYEDQVMKRGNAAGLAGVRNSKGNWTYKEEVAYPFGSGSSYASFERTNFKVTKQGDDYLCTLDVKNVGTSYAGEEAFQVYLQKPYTAYDQTTGIEKGAVEFVGTVKSGTLAPGEKETLSLSVKGKDFASYDSYGKKTYIREAGDYYLATGLNSHDALNNILAAKGYGMSDGMDASGDATMASKIAFDSDDFSSYSLSSVTGKTITNAFDNADINLYKGAEGQSVKYLSRSDWAGTYPSKAVQLTCVNETMVADMQYGGSGFAPDPKATMPLYKQNNGLTLLQLYYEKYDSPLWDKLLDEMTPAEQRILTSYGSEAMAGAASISAPGCQTHDGPAGIRGLADSVAYPSGTLMAATFNPALVEKLGNAYGMECLDAGYAGVYGPGANIHRSNFSGRNFEYYSEDPFLSGVSLSAEAKGLQNRGVIPFTKHFALNDQERNRYGLTVWANEQTIRETYLKGFEIAVEDGKMMGMMSSFSRVGCTWTGNHKGLLSTVLRGEWGFEGVVETDAAVSPYMNNKIPMAKGVISGQDLWLGGNMTNVYGEYSENPEVAQGIRRAAKNVLYAELHSNAINGLKTGSKIVAVTPSWKKAIKGVEIGAGILFGLCLVGTAVAFIVYAIMKQKGAI